MTIVSIRKCLVFSIRSSWRSICRHPFVAALLLFMLFLYVYFPSIFAFIVYSSPVIACTALLLGALLVYGEPDIRETEAVKTVNFSVKVAEKDERSRDFTVLKKDEKNISEENVNTRGGMSLTKVGPFDGDGHGKDDMDLAASCSSKIAEKEIQTEKAVTNEEESCDLEFMEKEVFSIENPADHALRIAEGLKVEIEKPLDGQFDSSLGSPWQEVNSNEVSSDSESDESEGEQSLSPDTSMTDIVPIIDELHPLLESENPQPVHGSIDTSDTASRASSPEHEFDDGSAEEETENQADEEDEEAQEENDNDEAVVKWTADDQKNLMDLGSSELERNQRLENLIAKRRAKKLQRFQTDKNLIDLDTEPLPFLEEITRLNVQVPAISAARSNPFDLPFDSEDSFGLLPIPGSAPSVLLPRRNPFELPYDQHEESSKLTGESSRPYDASISQRDPPPRRIDGLNLDVVSDDANQGKNERQLKPYFVPEKMSGTSFASFEGQLSDESDSESSASASDSASAVFNQDHELLKHETHERVSSVHEVVRSFDQESDLSVEVGSANLEQEHDVAVEEEEIGEVDSSSPVSSGANLEVIDERYDGASSSSCSEEDDKCIERSDHIEPINSAHTVGVLSVLKPGLLDKGAEDPHDSPVAEPSLSAKRVEGADDSQVAADPVYDSSPSAKSASHIPSLEALFSNNVKGKEGFQEVFSTPKAFEQGATYGAGDFKFDRKSMPPAPHDYIEGVESDPENVVDKVKGPNEVNANLREIKSLNEGSDLGISIGQKFLVEDLISDGEIQELQPKPSKQLDSSMMVDPCTEKEDASNQFQFPLLRSDDAGVSVSQHSNLVLNSSHDQHSANEQPSTLESDAGSSAPFDGNMEMKDAKLHISEPFVVDTNETVSSSTSESTVDNSEAPENFPKPLNSKGKLGHSEYDVKEKQSDAD